MAPRNGGCSVEAQPLRPAGYARRAASDRDYLSILKPVNSTGMGTSSQTPPGPDRAIAASLQMVSQVTSQQKESTPQTVEQQAPPQASPSEETAEQAQRQRAILTATNIFLGKLRVQQDELLL